MPRLLESWQIASVGIESAELIGLRTLLRRWTDLKSMMTGTILNAAGILIGGIAGLTLTRQMPARTQYTVKVLLGIFTIFIGLKMTFSSLGPGFGLVLKQLFIVVLALTLGRIVGRLVRVQKGLNFMGQYAQKRIATPDPSNQLSEGFVTCTILFCVGPIAILGAVQDGLDGQWQTLGIKAVMDGLATMAFVSMFGWGVILSVIPVVAYQGTLTLGARFLAPHLENPALLESVSATGGMLVFCVALIILEIRRIELGDYLPALAFAPVITWLWS